jgi:hypothetical protein
MKSIFQGVLPGAFQGRIHDISDPYGLQGSAFAEARSFRGDLPYSARHKIPENIVSALSKASLR